MQAHSPEQDITSFEGVVVIVGGGSVDAGLLRELHRAGAGLVGADGGADAIAAAGLLPELIVGDLDSLRDPGGWPPATRVLRIAEQETTDFEKALYSTRAPVTVALGMTGKRLDHTLAALEAVSRHAPERSIVVVDEHDIAVALAGPFAFAVAAGERVSIHPLGHVRFRSSSGLRYALDGLTLAPGLRTGTSNEAVAGPFTVEPEDGAQTPYLVILDKRYLLPLLAVLRPPRRTPSPRPEQGR